MESPQASVLVRRFRNALEKLDSKEDRLSESQKMQYRILKQRFEAQMNAWQNVSVSETDQMTRNLQESYNEIEAIWYSAHRQHDFIR